jgi:hypothetical protein
MFLAAFLLHFGKKALLYKKNAQKTLMKSTPDVIWLKKSGPLKYIYAYTSNINEGPSKFFHSKLSDKDVSRSFAFRSYFSDPAIFIASGWRFLNYPISFHICLEITSKYWQQQLVVSSQTQRSIRLIECATTAAGFNFINVLRTAFTPVDPKSVERH